MAGSPEQTAEKPKRKRHKLGRTGSPEQGKSIGLMSLTQGYLANPEAFARPAPPARRPLPLAFRCKQCKAPVAPNASTCGECGELFYFPNSQQKGSQ